MSSKFKDKKLLKISSSKFFIQFIFSTIHFKKEI